MFITVLTSSHYGGIFHGENLSLVMLVMMMKDDDDDDNYDDDQHNKDEEVEAFYLLSGDNNPNQLNDEYSVKILRGKQF